MKVLPRLLTASIPRQLLHDLQALYTPPVHRTQKYLYIERNGESNICFPISPRIHTSHCWVLRCTIDGDSCQQLGAQTPHRSRVFLTAPSNDEDDRMASPLTFLCHWRTGEIRVTGESGRRCRLGTRGKEKKYYPAENISTIQ